MPRRVLFLNDFDTYRLGFVVERFEGPGSSARLDYRTQGVPGRMGGVLLDPAPIVPNRTIRIVGALEAATPALARSNLEQLRARFNRGLLEVRFSDQMDRVWFARRVQGIHDAERGQVRHRILRYTVELESCDAYAYATQATVTTLVATRTSLPLGTAPSAPVISLMGSGTDPVVTYRRADGTVAQTLSFVGLTLGSNDFLEVDAEAQVITLSTNGVRTSGNALKSAGRFFGLDPADGDAAASDWPTLEVTGVTQGAVLYRKAYA